MNNYQAAAAAAAQGFGPPASPHATNTRAGFPPANSPGPTIDMYNSSAADSVAGYVQAASPQPSGFPAIAVSRAPINYNPVSTTTTTTYQYYHPSIRVCRLSTADFLPRTTSFRLNFLYVSTPSSSITIGGYPTRADVSTSDLYEKLHAAFD
ncbi:hypothetical protein RUM43_005410 [Polyplax serrata]|uniref:Uncharacterized protein n=1 Tax=Polyplax serrata TaxID=468196 RepID=A0AAN8S8M4_POLSC